MKMFKEFELPDGSIAECPADIDKFLSRSGCALAQDYSERYRQNVNARKEKAQRDSLWAEFLNNYKRMIWNE